ncbi:MAG: response regulator transcription factor [Bacteroidetes bacterium]|nr:response regulator transcription factor [Bacteroidota bacterium]
MKTISLALVDDHRMLRHGLVEVIQKNPAYRVVLEADNGRDFIDKLAAVGTLPDLVLLDINMPVMNGYETALWLKNQHPSVKVMALSMLDNESSIIRMLKNGARGYILKEADNEELYEAIDRVMAQGFYYTDLVVGALSNTMHSPLGMMVHPTNLINAREMEFIRLACSELTYKEIADEMNLSARTIDGYRESLFDKLNVKSRVGLVMYAINNGLLTS